MRKEDWNTSEQDQKAESERKAEPERKEGLGRKTEPERKEGTGRKTEPKRKDGTGRKAGPETDRSEQSRRRQRGRRRRRVNRFKRQLPIRPAVMAWAAGGVAAAAVLVIVLTTWVPNAGILPDPVQAQVDILPDSHARNGTLHAAEERTVEEGDFWVVINQIPKVELGKKTCNLEYENPEANHYSARVNLYLTETGEHLGGTRRVDPGSYVKDITLTKKLETGDYPVTAQIELFQEKTPAGSMSLDIILRVLEEGDRIG